MIISLHSCRIPLQNKTKPLHCNESDNPALRKDSVAHPAQLEVKYEPSIQPDNPYLRKKSAFHPDFLDIFSTDMIVQHAFTKKRISTIRTERAANVFG